MKQKLLVFLLAVFIAAPAFAQDNISMTTGIIGNGRLLGAQTYDGQTIVGILGVDSSGNTVLKSLSGKSVAFDAGLLSSASSIQLKVDEDAQRLFTFDASSDTALTQTFGDGGTTATQIYSIMASTTDAYDDSTLRLMGGGAFGNSRGGYGRLMGNEVASNGGSVEFFLGDVNTADFKVSLENASSDFIVADTTSGNLFSITNAGVAVLVAGDYRIAGAGTLALQEATAGTKCMGTATANGTTAVVVSTTCATTGSRIMLSRSSAPSGTAICWWDTLSNGVSFNLDCNAAETGTFDWVIFHEAP